MSTRIGLSLVPLPAVSILSEIVNSIIPNQRLDRMAEFISELDIRLTELCKKFPDEFVDSLLKNEQFHNLIIEGGNQAIRAVNRDRIKYLVSIIEYGISDETVDYEMSMYLMRILGDLSDPEIIFLKYYYLTRFNPVNREQYAEKHQNIIYPKLPFSDNINEYVMQKLYTVNLEKYGLVSTEKIYDKNNRIKIDGNSLLPEIRTVQITPLGVMIINRIGEMV